MAEHPIHDIFYISDPLLVESWYILPFGYERAASFFACRITCNQQIGHVRPFNSDILCGIIVKELTKCLWIHPQHHEL